MRKVVFKSLTVENFVTFADKICFTTEIEAGKKENLHNAFECYDSFFNKVSFLYGANGSGKTYFCKAIREIQRILALSPLMTVEDKGFLGLPQFKGINSEVKPFAFEVSYQDKPTKFSIEIIIDDILYHYEFSIKKREILYELLTKRKRRTEILIERSSSDFKDITLYSQLKEFENNKHTVKSAALCLPIAALLNNRVAGSIVEAINQIHVINMTAANLSSINNKSSFSDERKIKYLNVLKRADPTLREMSISFEEEEVVRQEIDNDDFENRSIIATKTTVGVSTTHAVYSEGEEIESTPISFFGDESLGTIKLFTVLPHLYDVLEKGGVLVIDEVENGLHLSLVKEIINLFVNEFSNPNYAQLICTSHQPLLIDGDFRRDQVWVTSKNSFGKSSLHRMSELKTSRAKVNLANRILEGAFGCNPDCFFENNT